MLGDGFTHVWFVSSNHIDRCQPSILMTVKSELAVEGIVEQLRQFADGHAVGHGLCVECRETEVRRIGDRAVDQRAGYGIRTIQHEELELCLAASACRCPSSIRRCRTRRRPECRRPACRSLRAFRRPAGFAVEAYDRQAGLFFDGIADFLVEFAEQTVLGGEDFDELAVVGGGQEIDGSMAVPMVRPVWLVMRAILRSSKSLKWLRSRMSIPLRTWVEGGALGRPRPLKRARHGDLGRLRLRLWRLRAGHG